MHSCARCSCAFLQHTPLQRWGDEGRVRRDIGKRSRPKIYRRWDNNRRSSHVSQRRDIHQWRQAAAGGVVQTNEGTVTFKCEGWGYASPRSSAIVPGRRLPSVPKRASIPRHRRRRKPSMARAGATCWRRTDQQKLPVYSTQRPVLNKHSLDCTITRSHNSVQITLPWPHPQSRHHWRLIRSAWGMRTASRHFPPLSMLVSL
jgi:hypothetical protein